MTRVLNILWGFSTGGIGKCFLTYDKLGEIDKEIFVKSVCVVEIGSDCDTKPLKDQDIDIISIKGNCDFSWLNQLKTIYDNVNPDFIFCHGHNGPVIVSIFKLVFCKKTPVICTCHGVNLNRNKWINKYVESLWMFIYRRRYVRKIICVEQFTPPVLCLKGVKKEKIVTVYNGIEQSIDATPVELTHFNVDAPVIITASRLTRIKGIDYLIDALSLLKNKGIKFFYFCIGNGEEEEYLKGMAADKGLTDKDIRFMGYQNNVPEWLAACDVFALPSLEEFHSIAILEAMRAKKAIVATNIGGNPESLRDGIDALLVPSMNSIALADALEKVLTSPELRERLSTSARERFLEKFTIDVMKKNLAREIMAVSN